MKIGFKKFLFDEVPDPFVGESEIAVHPIAYLTLMPSGNIGVTYNGSKFSKIWNYWKVYKTKDVIRKSLSRSFAESIRNDKWMVTGLGISEHGLVCFFHPAAQKYQSVLSCAYSWIKKIEDAPSGIHGWATLSPEIQKDLIPLLELSQIFPLASGKNIYPTLEQMDELKDLLFKQSFRPIEQVFPNKKIRKSVPAKVSNKGLSAVLFGYGNYARTITLPYLKPYIHLSKIHEIDPSLLINPIVEAVSTSPFPDSNDHSFSIWLIAGFHHTHANLAIDAMKNGVIPLIEKPSATTWEDYHSLVEIANITQVPFYQCYQKRYQIFNDFIYQDLNVKRGFPINFKATVFEIPLDNYHWYNWPSSGSRIISNGCHWIDHFLYLNGYPDWTDLRVFQPNSKELTIQIQLANGAFGLISLSDIGSNRIGMREYVEFTVPGKRAYIQDSMIYVSESNEKIIRTYKTDKLAYLRKMYREIGASIQNGGRGDDILTLKSTKLTLELEDILKSTISVKITI